MSKNKEQLMEELRSLSEKVGHSIKRRESPYRLYSLCVKYFGSFNKAKEAAKLDVNNKKFTSFEKKAFLRDKDLARIASYLTFDGHVYKSLRAFYFSSGDIKPLEGFEKLVKRKFGIDGKYFLNNGGAFKNKTHKFIVFNKILCEELVKAGVPKGDKVNQGFDVPRWISSSREFSKEYLKIAFFCEGSMKEEAARTRRIQINIAKTEEFLNSGIRFMETLRRMLRKEGIGTTKVYLSGNRVRSKDGKISKDIKFRISTLDNSIFINEIGWLK